MSLTADQTSMGAEIAPNEGGDPAELPGDSDDSQSETEESEFGEIFVADEPSETEQDGDLHEVKQLSAGEDPEHAAKWEPDDTECVLNEDEEGMVRHRKPPAAKSNGATGDESEKGSEDGYIQQGRRTARNRQMSWGQILKTCAGIFLVLSGAVGYVKYQEVLRSRVNTPLDAPRVVEEGATGATRSPDRFWGTYRSNVYFGMKTRSPRSLVTGMMWMVQYSRAVPRIVRPEVRHTCEQGDGLPRYGWLQHDGVNFGMQEIIDKNFSMVTEFVKRPGGDHGGDWTWRITASPRKSKSISIPTVSFLFYAATDGQGTIQPVLENNRLVAITGQTEELGKFRMSFPKVSRKNITYHHLVSYSPRLDLLKSSVEHGMRRLLFNKTRIQYGLAGDLIKRSNMPDLKANVLVHQVTLEVPCVLEVVFESESFTSRNTRLVGMELTRELEKYKVAFDEKFENTFGLNRRGYTEKNLRFAKAAVSNMVGGIGYFRGKSLVQSPYNEEPVEYWEAPLYTAVPSRSFFPRGFLWDEGFHQLLISKWDTAISKEILSHWLDLMNMEGWIPREQILGSEARSKVPAEFVVQKNQNANPPTLFLPIQSLMKDLASNRSEGDILLLKRMFPRLKTWYNWFNTSQLGNEPSSYRWRGRDPGANKNQQLNPLTLTSGLDDYPRASHPSDSERHIDLRCWMALASGVMADIAKVIGEPGEEYEATHKLLTDNALLEKLHWSPEKQLFSDYGKHTKGVVLEREKVPLPPPPKPGMRRQPVPKGKMYRVLKGEQPTDKFVNSFGYVSLFPFLLQIVDPKSPKLGKILTDLKNPQLLWTKYGLRSLAKTDPLYMKYNTEHDPPYWRGQIWINMNFLAVRALHHYSNIKGPYQSQAADTYKELRRNLIHNLYVEYERSGFIWENYSDVNGHGKGCHPFTGWSSLIVLIMAEKY
ncbi:mannosyl-oligosaccharide glucosidase-like [Branchiostoma floridae x Branchiostoma japonicum]